MSMSEDEAFAALGLPVGASQAQILEACRGLSEDYGVRIGNAPTNALKRTYQEKLEHLRLAVSVLIPGNGGVVAADLPSREPVRSEPGRFIRQPNAGSVPARNEDASEPERSASVKAMYPWLIGIATVVLILGAVRSMWPPDQPKLPAKPPAPAFATLLVSVDMDCTLYIDDATEGVALTAWTPKKVPIDRGEHILRWHERKANVIFSTKATIDKPGTQIHEYKISEDVKPWQEKRDAELAQLMERERADIEAAGVVVRGDLMWTVRDNGRDVNWNEAKAYCEACRVGGYSDWRMPTIEELEGLYVKENSYKTRDGYADYLAHIAKPFVLTTPWQWSSTLQGSSSAFVFDFNLVGGRSSSDLTYRDLDRVLCVRRSGE
jgi:Protein of unknown function (DUF1566)